MNKLLASDFLRRMRNALSRHAIEEWRRSICYPIAGFFLAQGAPVGLLIMRAWEDSMWPSVTWLAAEMGTDQGAYVYLTLSTSFAFMTLGLILGSQEDRLRKLAVTDPLTGLCNRRYFGQRFVQELARAQRYRTPLSLLIVDLDWLKTINDGGGHAAGDRAIKAVAATLEQNLRTTDIAARYAGDEFVALLPQTQAAEALELAKRVNAHVRQWQCGPHQGPLSVSIGVADLAGAGGETLEDLFDAADNALYAAKSAGRDSAVAAPTRKLALLG